MSSRWLYRGLAQCLWRLHKDTQSLWATFLTSHYGQTPMENPRAMRSFFLRDLNKLLPLFNTCTSITPNGVITWRFGINGTLSSTTTYKLINHTGMVDHLGTVIWKLKIPERIKIFLWLLARDKLLTATNLAKRNWPHSTLCHMCGVSIIESATHLFLHCHVAREIWTCLASSHPMQPNDAPIRYWSTWRSRLPPLAHSAWDQTCLAISNQKELTGTLLN
jgi:zinc-binding in reverse transcriptase